LFPQTPLGITTEFGSVYALTLFKLKASQVLGIHAFMVDPIKTAFAVSNWRITFKRIASLTPFKHFMLNGGSYFVAAAFRTFHHS
jgi:hypothetical protein